VFGGLNLDVASSAVTIPNIINGFATALIFVPLTTLTMSTLRNEQMGNATGIFNLMRNLGGGVGIAFVTTMLSRGAQTHQSIMVGNLTPYDPAYQHQIRALAHGLAPKVGAAAPLAAQAITYREMLRQAQLWAYVDNFRLLALFCFLCIPLVFIFRRGAAKGPVMMH
jgi:DHA2 family multidrug resistance protein